MSAIIKHIGVMKWPDRSPFALSPILEAYTLLEHGAPRYCVNGLCVFVLGSENVSINVYVCV